MELEESSAIVSGHNTNPRNGLFGYGRPTRYHAHRSWHSRIPRNRVAQRHPVTSARPVTHARDVLLGDRASLELRRESRICLRTARKDEQAARIAVETLVDA
jgi:hypothetical protein